jgi:actin-like ATPase involved in cell morphogenesis
MENSSKTESVVPSTEGRIGLDVGTSKILVARRTGRGLEASVEVNAFIPLPYSRITENILLQNKVHYYQENSQFYVYGNSAEKFASLFNAETRRPMSRGLINPHEPSALTLIKVIIQGLVKKPKSDDELVCFSVPGAPVEAPSDLIYHEEFLKNYLTELGYRVKSINEGQAVVFSELEKESFTGIGVSAGGGMCNVCLAFLSVPVISFSISKAGDYIDRSVGSVTGESATRVKMIKEASLDLSRTPGDKVEEALHIYYDDVIQTLVTNLNESFGKASSVPKLDRAVPVVLAGGTARPKGFREKFEEALKESDCPIEISAVRLSPRPMQATAAGALVAAVNDS